MTSSEQLIASFATRCAWPHLEHERLLSHPSIGAKAVSANKCPRAFKSSPVGRPFAIVLQKPPSFHSLFKPSWPSDRRPQSGEAHTGRRGWTVSGSGIIVTPGVPERVTRHVFSCFTPPQFNVRVFVDQYPYIIIHLTICQHFFLFHTKNTLLQVFFKI